MKKRTQRVLIICFFLGASGILYATWCQGTGLAVPCLFHVITKFYCPGCGITRCILHLLHFEWKEAFFCNMAFIILLPFFVYFLFYHIYSYIRYGSVKYTKRLNILIYVCLIFFLLFGILRNLPPFYLLRPMG